MKLKDLIYEYAKMLDSYEDVEKFLKDFKQKNPKASEDQIADAILKFLYSRSEVEESLASTAMNYILPALMSIYGSNITASVGNILKSKLKSKHTYVTQKPLKVTPIHVSHWAKQYAKKYGIPEKNIMNLLHKESSFSAMAKNYDPYIVADKNNVLGPSYGACQVKVATAKEIYTQEPESDVSVGSITADKLTNDVKFNIRTAAKILAHYYHDSFKKIKNPRTRMQYAATAYNAGKAGARQHGINRYGKYVAG